MKWLERRNKIPFQTNGKRDYKKELQWEHENKPKRVKERAARNSARKKLGIKVGDPRHVDHADNNQMNNSLSNLHAISAKANLEKEANRKKRNSKKWKKDKEEIFVEATIIAVIGIAFYIIWEGIKYAL